MVRFMIYLLETGLCLSLLYLAYWLVLRKETYFNFNRLFLVGSFVLTLGVPLLHINFFIPEGSSLENSARSIVQFRSYYEEVVRVIDADFGIEPGSRHSYERNSTGGPGHMEEGMIPSEKAHSTKQSGLGSDYNSVNKGFAANLSFARILLIIYICGVIYFLARFVYLVIRLYRLAKQNSVTRQNGFRMVEIKEDISPFSFFHFLFINNGSFNNTEFQQVLEHEKAHIRQRHSMDHLFAHGLAVFQWFNPFAWQISKALKTTHEYIADRQVLDQGIELIDYQSLLLRQVIGYHSVELVNNFNLKPIKKRIAMMNKHRSGIPAKLKALLVIPFAIIVFFLFADFTMKGTSQEKVKSESGLEGLWIKQSSDEFSSTLFIKNQKFSFTEGITLRDYFIRTEKKTMILSERKEPVE